MSDSLSLSLNTSNLVQTAGGPSDTDPDSPGYDDEEPASDALMHSSVCRGGKLQIACTQNADKAANYIAPVYSLWDGSMYTEFTKWGYKDDNANPARAAQCDFSSNSHDVQSFFNALKMYSRSSAAGGPNICYTIIHFDGPTVKLGPDGQMPARYNQRYDADGKDTG